MNLLSKSGIPFFDQHKPMQSFRTVLPIKSAPISIQHEDKLLCLGSCFAEHIAQLLTHNKFDVLLNPFGILYNPHSIAVGLNRLMIQKKFELSDLVQWEEYWHSFEHHGHFSGLTAEETLKQINASLEKGIEFLKTTNRLIITLGTSYVFVYQSTGKIVANCHKIPATQFKRERLELEATFLQLQAVFKKLKDQNSALEIILTVSPVRHIRDGIIENQRSKALLLLLTEKLCAHFSFVHYFPSYELLMDDLRDYRFYTTDLIHPNDMAIQYIWEAFRKVYFNSTTEQLLKKIAAILNGVQHRPIHPKSKAHQHFLQLMLKKIQNVTEEHQILDFTKEKELILQQINSPE